MNKVMIRGVNAIRMDIPVQAMRKAVLFIGFLIMTGCANTGQNSPGGRQDAPADHQAGFRLSNLAKSDASFLADTALDQIESMLQELLVKLYKRNPRELAKGAESDINVRIESIFGRRNRLLFDELQGREEIYAMLLGLDPAYQGDRVFAIMAGLTGMLRRSYGYKDEFFLLDSLNGQAIYNAARNIEVLSWRLRIRKNEQGEPLLLTNGRPGEPQNLSFERLFGRLIGLQDLMAEFAASRNNRAITKVVHSVGSLMFLPVP